MTPIPDKPGHYAVQAGETITIRITEPNDAQDKVNCTWNGKPQPPQSINDPFTRTIGAQDPNPCTLGITVHFFDKKGGSFVVVLSGDKNGDPHRDAVEKGGSFANIVYWFDRA